MSSGSITERLAKAGDISPAHAYATDISYEVITGSFSYGVSNDTSDKDVIGVFVPPLEVVFPHLTGNVPGFGPEPNKTDIYQKHHIQVDEGEVDVTLYSLVKFFDLCAENNPNMVDALFVPPRCITHMDDSARIMRDNRRLFLHKGSFHRFRGYALQQMKNVKNKAPVGKRVELVKKFGYDVKFAYHIVRLLNECEDILMTQDLDLEKSREMLKAVRNGEWTIEELEEWSKKKTNELDTLYINSTLRHSPDYDQLKRVLLMCLESKYGSIDRVILTGDEYAMVRKYKIIEKLIRE